MYKNNKGITLIALVVSIIVLIILAGVSINLIIGNDGIIGNAKYAKENIESAQAEEYNKLDELYLQLEQEIKMDRTKPEEATITISGTTTQTSLPVVLNAKITHTDNESGIAITSCKYVINTSSSEIGTTASSYTGGTFSSNEENITISLNTIGEWYLHVLSVDNDENAQETIKGPITIEANYHTHTGSSSSGGGCYTKQKYKTETYTYQYTCGYKDANSYFDGNRSCPSCGGGMWVNDDGNGTNIYYCKGDKNGTRTGTRTVSDGYEVDCGKTETTIESYTITY